MKNKMYQKRFKLGMATVFMLAVSALSAQQTTGDVTKEADAIPGTTTVGGAIRVIDNKGTIKYLQSQNGITLLSNTTDDVTTTTWQLGGTLSSNTEIELNDGTTDFDFTINGVNYSLENIATTAASAATATTAESGTETGYALLVRNEATGNVEKLLATDLLQSGQESFTTTAAQVGTPDFTLAGSPVLPGFSQVWVYRNGAKLIANIDYTVLASTVTLVPNTTVGPNQWSLFEDDVIEVQFVK